MTATPNENTVDPAEARRALEESQRNHRRTEGVVNDARKAFSLVVAHGQRNHYTEKANSLFRRGI